jgi:hypothetical protein
MKIQRSQGKFGRHLRTGLDATTTLTGVERVEWVVWLESRDEEGRVYRVGLNMDELAQIIAGTTTQAQMATRLPEALAVLVCGDVYARAASTRMAARAERREGQE